MFVYVTGVAGSGKSVIAEALRARGIAAYDEDAPGVGSAHNKATGQPVAVPSADERTPEWFDAHEWRVLDAALGEMRELTKHQAVVLCGNSFSDDRLRELDAKVIYLQIDDATLKRRIVERTDNDYGKTQSEFADIRQRHRDFDKRFLHTATVIDANRALDQVIEDLIAMLKT